MELLRPLSTTITAPTPLDQVGDDQRLSPALRTWVGTATHPALTVVIPTFQQEHLIIPTIASVAVDLAHRDEPFEIVIADDHSDDDTVNRCRALGLENLCVVSTARYRGQNAALRRGMHAGRGLRYLTTDANCSVALHDGRTREIAPGKALLRRVTSSRIRTRSRQMATTSECVLNASRRLDAFAVRDLIEAVYDCDDPTVFINMSATTFIDEVAVHAIRRAAASFERTRRELLIVWPSEAVTFTLKLLGIQLDIWPRRGGSDAWAGSGPLSA